MHQLRPCPSCSRHVRVSEAACLFCGAALDEVQVTAPRSAVPARLGRAAIFAFGTATATVVACAGGGDPTGDASTPSDASSGGSDAGGNKDAFTSTDTGSGGVDTGPPDTGCIAKPYGAPPANGFEIV